jgi:DNA polymerase V
MVLDIVPEWVTQLSLFDRAPRTKDKELMRSIDKINNTFGRNAVQMGIVGNGRAWDLRRQHLSKKFTTDLNDLLTIKI